MQCTAPCLAAPAQRFSIYDASEDNEYFDASYIYVDIQLKSVYDLQVYRGKGTIEELAKEANALLAINCIFWHYEYIDKQIVFNGELVHNLETPSIRDYCIITKEGKMQILLDEEVKTYANFPDDVWQIWSFGPALVHNGEIIEEFYTPFSYTVARDKHPRTAIGYFSPNHFCFLIVAGRNDEDRGASLEEMAIFFKNMGCVEAYNLDGGGSSHIWYNGYELGAPSDDRVLTEIIYIDEEHLQN